MRSVEAQTRIQLKNILFATDFSPAADAAAPYAIELTRRYGAKLYALHVRPPVVTPLTAPESWRDLETTDQIEAGRRKLVDLFAGTQAQIWIRQGDLWPSLAAVIEETNTDLIVMGTRGRSGIRKFLLGSTAEEIFRQAPCPVLTVGPHSTATKQTGEITRILFATDFSPESTAAAPYAISFAQEYQAYLTLLHVIEEAKTGDLIRPSELVSSSTQLLRNLVSPEAELWCVPEYLIERGPVAEKILEIAADRKVDLIVLGARQPSGFWGAATHLPIAIAHKAVSHAECPVLTVRINR